MDIGEEMDELVDPTKEVIDSEVIDLPAIRTEPAVDAAESLAPVGAAPPAPLPWNRPLTIAEIISTAQVFARSKLFADSEEVLVVKLLAGREWGIAPYSAATGITVVRGKAQPHYTIIGTMLKRHGYSWVEERSDAEACILTFSKRGVKIGQSYFTIQQAQRAGLLVSDAWKKYPETMLFARALSVGQKRLAPEVFGGPVYDSSDEVE